MESKKEHILQITVQVITDTKLLYPFARYILMQLKNTSVQNTTEVKRLFRSCLTKKIP